MPTTSVPSMTGARAKSILFAAQGREGIEVADELHVSNQTVSKWRSRCRADQLLLPGDTARAAASRSIDEGSEGGQHGAPPAAQSTHGISRMLQRGGSFSDCHRQDPARVWNAAASSLSSTMTEPLIWPITLGWESTEPSK